MNGTDIVLYVDDTGTGEMTLIGSQRDVSFDESNESIDVSSKDAREKRVLAGRYSAKVSLDALYVPTDLGYLALQDALRDGTLIQISRYETGGAPPTSFASSAMVGLEWATAIVTKVGTKGPDQDAAVVSVELEIDGAWTAVTP